MRLIPKVVVQDIVDGQAQLFRSHAGRDSAEISGKTSPGASTKSGINNSFGFAFTCDIFILSADLQMEKYLHRVCYL
jgi:hypothetical protein